MDITTSYSLGENLRIMARKKKIKQNKKAEVEDEQEPKVNYDFLMSNALNKNPTLEIFDQSCYFVEHTSSALTDLPSLEKKVHGEKLYLSEDKITDSQSNELDSDEIAVKNLSKAVEEEDRLTNDGVAPIENNHLNLSEGESFQSDIDIEVKEEIKCIDTKTLAIYVNDTHKRTDVKYMFSFSINESISTIFNAIEEKVGAKIEKASANGEKLLLNKKIKDYDIEDGDQIDVKYLA